MAAGGGISHLLSGAQVVLNDPTTPAASIEASGLLVGGPRSGSDPITLDATDNGGIRRVEIIDVTAGGASVVGAEDYATGARTVTGATCSFRLAKACPNLKNETIRPTSLAAGQRTLKVRVTDAGGNVLEQGPYAVNVATPSDRGPLNGSGATEDGKLTAHFTGTTKTRRTVNYRSRASISGRLLNSSGKPITGALLRVLTRDRRQSAGWVERYTTTTKADGSYRIKVRAAASRLTQIAWRSHVKDPGFQETAYVTLLARASASLKARPRSVGVGGRVRLSGTDPRHDPHARRAGDLPGPLGQGPLHDVRRGPRRPQGPLPASATASARPPRAGARSASASSSAATPASPTRPATPSA